MKTGVSMRALLVLFLLGTEQVRKSGNPIPTCDPCPWIAQLPDKEITTLDNNDDSVSLPTARDTRKRSGPAPDLMLPVAPQSMESKELLRSVSVDPTAPRPLPSDLK
jgi:hypothetical protein